MKTVVDPGASIPTRAHPEDAGLDLYCKTGGWIWPHSSRTFDTGVHIELPPGTFGKVESKSGLNVNNGVVSCGGVIDQGYTGSIRVKLYNLSWKPYRVHDGDKIAQIIIMECLKPKIELAGSVEELGETDRGSKGFGSSGR